MEEFLLKIRLLTDIVGKKKQVLNQILDITENQETVLLQPKPEITLFNEMNMEKQNHIQTVLQADDFFQNVFDSIKEIFEKNAKNCADEIKQLQAEIKAVIDLDIKIRVKEQRNKMLLPKPVTSLKGVPNKKYVLEQYQKNKKV